MAIGRRIEIAVRAHRVNGAVEPRPTADGAKRSAVRSRVCDVALVSRVSRVHVHAPLQYVSRTIKEALGTASERQQADACRRLDSRFGRVRAVFVEYVPPSPRARGGPTSRSLPLGFGREPERLARPLAEPAAVGVSLEPGYADDGMVVDRPGWIVPIGWRGDSSCDAPGPALGCQQCSSWYPLPIDKPPKLPIRDREHADAKSRAPLLVCTSLHGGQVHGRLARRVPHQEGTRWDLDRRRLAGEILAARVSEHAEQAPCGDPPLEGRRSIDPERRSRKLA